MALEVCVKDMVVKKIKKSAWFTSVATFAIAELVVRGYQIASSVPVNHHWCQL